MVTTRKHIPQPEANAPPPAPALFRIDPGWLFLIPGIVLLMAAVLIPAKDDLTEARHLRDRAYSVEDWHTQRLARYSAYLDALDQRDETVVRSLAASQLNMTTEEFEPVLSAGLRGGASVFPELEPPFTPLDPPTPPDTRLQRLASKPEGRLWLVGLGGLCVLIGLMPWGSPTNHQREDLTPSDTA